MPAKPKSPSSPEPKFVPPDHELGAYANHVQVSITNSELILDFFFISPELNPLQSTRSGLKQGKLVHVQRTIVPLSLSKGIASAIANVVAEYEKNQKIVLVNSREAQPDDLIKIWDNQVDNE